MAITLDEDNQKVTCVYKDHSMYIWDIRDIKRVGKSHSFLFHSACIWGIEVWLFALCVTLLKTYMKLFCRLILLSNMVPKACSLLVHSSPVQVMILFEYGIWMQTTFRIVICSRRIFSVKNY